MASTPLIRLLLAMTALVCAVGLVDAAVGAVWDLVVVQGAVLVLLGVLALASSVGRAHVRLRRDLFRWLERYAAEGGERTADVADRAVAAYRAGLTADVRGSGGATDAH